MRLSFSASILEDVIRSLDAVVKSWQRWSACSSLSADGGVAARRNDTTCFFAAVLARGVVAAVAGLGLAAVAVLDPDPVPFPPQTSVVDANLVADLGDAVGDPNVKTLLATEPRGRAISGGAVVGASSFDARSGAGAAVGLASASGNNASMDCFFADMGGDLSTAGGGDSCGATGVGGGAGGGDRWTTILSGDAGGDRRTGAAFNSSSSSSLGGGGGGSTATAAAAAGGVGVGVDAGAGGAGGGGAEAASAESATGAGAGAPAAMDALDLASSSRAAATRRSRTEREPGRRKQVLKTVEAHSRGLIWISPQSLSRCAQT